jgi:tetratricopeptide (TPR) repeat protein
MLTPYIEDHIGQGIFIDKKGEEVYFQHGGWDEGFSSQLVAHRDKGLGVVVLTNSNHPAFIDELIRAVAITYNWPNYVPTYQSVPLTAEDIQSIQGKYLYDRNEVVNILEDDGKLFFKYLRWEPMQVYKVNDSTYMRKERTAPLLFKTNPADGKRYLVFGDSKPEERWNHPLMAEGEKVPLEYLVEGDWDSAVKAYRQLKKDHPDDPSIQEQNINREGYNLLDRDVKLAVLVFKMNCELFPTSGNAFDSYADGLKAAGDKDGAIANYKKAIMIDPKLTETKRKLEELMKAN